jgi:VanZ family protein
MKFSRAWLYFIPALIYCGFIFFLSSHSLKLKFSLTFCDKGAHWLEFAALGFLLALGFFYNLPRRTFPRAYLTIMTGIFIGLVDELHQRFVPGRQCDWRDWIADITGVIVGLAIFWLIFSIKERKSAGKSSAARP